MYDPVMHAISKLQPQSLHVTFLVRGPSCNLLLLTIDQSNTQRPSYNQTRVMHTYSSSLREHFQSTVHLLPQNQAGWEKNMHTQ